MKAAVVATAAAAVLAGGVSAHRDHHRQAHQGLFEKRAHNETETCVPGCTTIYSTITGEAGLYFPPAPTTTSTPVASSAAPTTAAPPSSATSATVPTLISQFCPTTGVYTFPATTVVVTETTTVCGASTTELPSGTHTLGGVTTVVETETTIVCPYATTKTENGVVTNVLETTTYVCPSAGTYTIAPITTTVTALTTVVLPVVTTYVPATYTAPAVVTTVTQTNYVVYCPFTAEAVPTPAPVAPAAVEQAAPPAAEVAPSAAAAPAPEAAPPAEAAPSAAAVPSSVSSPSASKGGSLGGKGDLWAMTYTPFNSQGDCKGASEVMADVQLIAGAGFTTLRVYSTDCDTLPSVGAAADAFGLRLIIGIFIGEVGCDNGSPDVGEQIAALKAWSRWDLVDLAVVGNEALFNHFCTVDELKNLILHVKSELGSVGYSGPFTTTDVVSAWQEFDVSAVCAVIDVVATNAHAYFNAATQPSNAGAFVKSQLEIVKGVCNLPGYVMETGWPTGGDCIGVACPGEEQQHQALASIKQELGSQVVFFSFTDDAWKKPGACNCEQHWGCAKVFGV
ncbi:glycoside hydrolase superfamily [Bombardia bombarda]|uniref:Probable beta-glucosidase btgE n=1 Tax=Bombardia bombarda TaxID=252184 RepID=A0AA39WNB3_9PEZI|nr:glycoside hydrolase superfamily [Bombardia bombarda]